MTGRQWIIGFVGFTALLCSGSLSSRSLLAQESTAPSRTPGEAQLKEWIERLAADSFIERQRATKSLRRAGIPAIPLLEKAARDANQERSVRSVQILERLYRNGEGDAKSKAKEALERIAQSGATKVARLAKEAIADPREANPAGPPPGGQIILRGGGIQLGGIQLQMMQGMRGGRQIRTEVRNGVKTVTLKEQGRTAKLVDDPNKGITMEITETKNGKKVTKQYKAKDAADLKTKSADAHKLYQEMSRNVGAQIQFRARMVPGAFPGAPPQRVPARGGIRVPKAKATTMLKQVEQSLSKLQSIKASGTIQAKLDEAIRDLKDVRKDLNELIGSK